MRRRTKQSSVERSISISSEVVKSTNSSIVDDVFYPSVETGGRLTKEETVEVGSIPFATYKAYIQSAGGFFLSTFVLLMFVVNVVGTGTAYNLTWIEKFHLNNCSRYSDEFMVACSLVE